MLEFRGEWSAWQQRVRLWILVRNGSDTLAVADPVTFRPNEQHIEAEPSLTLSEPEAQSLMDELWRAGLRPTEGTGSAGSLAATERHLADMRRLVFEGRGGEDPDYRLVPES